MPAEPALGESSPQGRLTWSFDAIGTGWEIETSIPVDEIVRGEIAALIALFDADWSRFRPDSRVSLLGRGGTVPAPADAVPMLDAFAELSTATSGAVNPLVGGSLERLGYDDRYSLAAGEPVAAPTDWRALLRWTPESLSLSRPATIDVGALGKGRLVDLVLAVLVRHGIGDAVVDASGDLAAIGSPQRIGLEHPYDPTRAIGVWEVTDAALCASASNRRAWGDGLHHVLDARTGMPVRRIVATWARAADAMHADAVATALFFDGGPELAHRWGVEWVRMLSDGRVEFSPDCSAELFSRKASVRA